jgi:putative SOS response-associated peptidase YedK
MQVGKKSYRVARDDGNFFYLAGVWEPPMAGYPLAFRIITVAANAEVADYQERHGAIILRRQVMDWLDVNTAETDLLVTPPPGTFLVSEIGAKRKPVEASMPL